MKPNQTTEKDQGKTAASDRNSAVSNQMERTVLVPVDLDTLLEMQNADSVQTADPGEFFPFSGFLLEHWRRLLASFFVAAIIGIMVSFAVTPIFKAEVTFIPIESGQASRFSAWLTQLSGLGLGVSDQKTPGGRLAVLLSSRKLARDMFTLFPDLQEIISPPSLLQRWFPKTEPPDLDRLAEDLQKIVTISVPRKDDEAIVLSVELPHATMSALIANAYMDGLASYVNQTSFTNAKKSREYIESQVALYQDTLTNAEENLRAFQEANRIVSLTAQTSAAIRVVGELKSRLLLKNIEREVRLKTATPNHPEVVLIDDQIAALKTQVQKMEEGQEDFLIRESFKHIDTPPFPESLASAPQTFANSSEHYDTTPLATSLASAPLLTLQHYRLRKNVEINSRVFDLLMNQLALARITEQNEAVNFQVIDRALIPRKKIRPKRSLFALVGGFIGILACGLFLNRRSQEEAKK